MESKFFDRSISRTFGQSWPNSFGSPTPLTFCNRRFTTSKLLKLLKQKLIRLKLLIRILSLYLCLWATCSNPTSSTKGAFMVCCMLSNCWWSSFAEASSSFCPYLEVTAFTAVCPTWTFSGLTNEADDSPLKTCNCGDLSMLARSKIAMENVPSSKVSNPFGAPVVFSSTLFVPINSKPGPGISFNQSYIFDGTEVAATFNSVAHVCCARRNHLQASKLG